MLPQLLFHGDVDGDDGDDADDDDDYCGVGSITFSLSSTNWPSSPSPVIRTRLYNSRSPLQRYQTNH